MGRIGRRSFRSCPCRRVEVGEQSLQNIPRCVRTFRGDRSISRRCELLEEKTGRITNPWAMPTCWYAGPEDGRTCARRQDFPKIALRGVLKYEQDFVRKSKPSRVGPTSSPPSKMSKRSRFLLLFVCSRRIDLTRSGEITRKLEGALPIVPYFPMKMDDAAITKNENHHVHVAQAGTCSRARTKIGACAPFDECPLLSCFVSLGCFLVRIVGCWLSLRSCSLSSTSSRIYAILRVVFVGKTFRNLAHFHR